MEHQAAEPPVVHLLMGNRSAPGPEPRGCVVPCPRRGEVGHRECLDCDDFSTLSFDWETHETFIHCRPKVA